MESPIWIAGAIFVFLLVFLILKAITVDNQTDSNSVDLSAIPQRFVVFDLETTGLDATRHEIIEIGAIRVNRSTNVHDTFQVLTKPVERIPKMITRINGISQDMVDRDGESLESALKNFAAFIEDLPLVSFNADFDMAFLLKSARQHKVVIRNRASCALKMARRAWPGRTSYRLCDLAKGGNLSDEGTHRALCDCKRTLVIYIAAASRMGADSIE